jgi:NADPH-dependent stearoyl-CoA 9-desaturase
MHDQYDWMKDPALDSKRFEWDTACPGDQWRQSHNYMHHTHTDVLGRDRDIGYGILRMSEDQPWRTRDLGNPIYATLLALLFQWGVAVHDLEVHRIEAGEIELSDKRDILRAIWRKGRRQVFEDYVAFPLLAGPGAAYVITGNLSANLVRNLWSFMIIFCGHFPNGVEEFSEEEVENETRGGWYVRQMLGVGQPDRVQAVPHPVGEPVPPDRASPVSGHPGSSLRRDRRRGPRDLPALWLAVQHRTAAQAVWLGGQEDLPPCPS